MVISLRGGSVGGPALGFRFGLLPGSIPGQAMQSHLFTSRTYATSADSGEGGERIDFTDYEHL